MIEDRRLQTFLTAAQLGSFSRAGAVLYCTQSTVTARISDLEKELGCKLFVREARGVTLTPEGRLLLPYVQRSLQLLEDARSALMSGSMLSNRLRVLACHVPAAYDLPEFIVSRPSGRDETPVQLRTAPSKQIFKSLLRGEADIGFVNVRFRHPDLDTEILAERPITVVVAAERLPESGSLIKPEEPVLFFEEELEDTFLARSVCHQLGMPESTPMGISDMGVLRAMLLKGYGIGIVPKQAVVRELEEGLLRELTDELGSLPKQLTCLIVRRDLAASPAFPHVKPFLSRVRAYYSEVRRAWN